MPAEAADSETIIDQIQRLIQERDSGFGFPRDLTPLEKELVITWDEAIAVCKRAHQMRVDQIFQLFAAMTARR